MSGYYRYKGTWDRGSLGTLGSKTLWKEGGKRSPNTIGTKALGTKGVWVH